MKRTLSVILNEWERCPPLQWPDRQPVFFPPSDSAHATAERLTRSNILSVVETRHGITLEASSFVGRIQLGPVKVTIQPKIQGLQLLRLMRYAYGLRDLKLFSNVDFDLQKDAFQEILISQLAMEAENLLSRGLHRQYVRHTAELVSPRGRIDINRIAANGGVIDSTLPCTYHPRDLDCLPNQVLSAGLVLAANICDNIMLRSKLHQLSKGLLAEVSPVRLGNHTFQRLDRESNRMVDAYQPAFRIIKILTQGQGVSLDNQDLVKFDGFLFDMNRFFQTLLSRFLSDHLAGYEVRDEYGLHGMMYYQLGGNPLKRRAPCPRPDFAIFQKNSLIRLLDAKYRDLWEKPLSRDMLYQLSIYALSQPPGPKSEAVILFPTLRRSAREARIQINDPVSCGSRGSVVIRPVNLDTLDELIGHCGTHGFEKRALAYAKFLAFGKTPEFVNNNTAP